MIIILVLDISIIPSHIMPYMVGLTNFHEEIFEKVFPCLSAGYFLASVHLRVDVLISNQQTMYTR